MLHLLSSVVLTSAHVASASDSLSTPQSGLLLDLGADVGVGSRPAEPFVGGTLAAGVWFGPYDPAYAIGRYHALGLVARAGVAPSSGDLRLWPMLELRRGAELIVVGLWGGLAGGPVLALPSEGDLVLGGAGRLALGGEFRRTRFLGLTARLDGGIDVIAGEVHPAGTLTLGVELSRPWKMLE